MPQKPRSRSVPARPDKPQWRIDGGIVKQPRRQKASTPPSHSSRKKKAKAKPEWDSTISDLSNLKLSRAEQELRKEAKLAANAERAKALQQQRKAVFDAVTKRERAEAMRLLNAPKQMNKSPNSKHMSKLMREVLYGNDQEALQNMLRGESGSVDILEELFGGDTLTFKSEPVLTAAPELSHSDSDEYQHEYNVDGRGSDDDEFSDTDILVWAEPTNRVSHTIHHSPDRSSIANAKQSPQRSTKTFPQPIVERHKLASSVVGGGSEFEVEQQKRVLAQASKRSPLKPRPGQYPTYNDGGLSPPIPRSDLPYPTPSAEQLPASEELNKSPDAPPRTLDARDATAQPELMQSSPVRKAANSTAADNLNNLKNVVESMEVRVAKIDPNAHQVSQGTTRNSYSAYMNRILLVVDRLIDHLDQSKSRESNLKQELESVNKKLDHMNASLESLKEEHQTLQSRVISTETRCTSLEQRGRIGVLGSGTGASTSPLSQLAQNRSRAIAEPVNSSPDVTKRLQAADAALTNLRREMPEVETTLKAFESTSAPKSTVDANVSYASKYAGTSPYSAGSNSLAWGTESPLRAAVESASAATGLSVQELLGHSFGDQTQRPAMSNMSAGKPLQDSYLGYSSVQEPMRGEWRGSSANDRLLREAEAAFDQRIF